MCRPALIGITADAFPSMPVARVVHIGILKYIRASVFELHLQ